MLSWLPEDVSTLRSGDRPALLRHLLRDGRDLLHRPDHAPRLPRSSTAIATGGAPPTRTATPRSRSPGRSRRRSSSSILAVVSRSDLGGDQGARAARATSASRSPPSSSTGRSPIPGPDGKLGTDDDVTMDNDLHVPVNKTVRLRAQVARRHPQLLHPEPPLQAGRWCPATTSRPGSRRPRPGKYEIPCAELCGFGHSGMKGWLYVAHAGGVRGVGARRTGSAAAARAAERASLRERGDRHERSDQPRRAPGTRRAEHHEVGFIRTTSSRPITR